MCSAAAEDASKVGDVLLTLGRARSELHQRFGEWKARGDVTGELEHSGAHDPPGRAGEAAERSERE